MFNTTFLNGKGKTFLDDMEPYIIQRFRDLFEFYFDAFDLYTNTDTELVDTLTLVFPRHYLLRNMEKAKEIIFDLDDIAKSTIIRKELSPIRTYALFHILQSEYEAEIDMRLEGATFFDDNEMVKRVKSILKKHKVAKDERNYIVDWFCHYQTMIEDMQYCYDGDYAYLSLLEEAAEIYINY